MRELVREFQDRAPWWGGDLQTLRNQLVAFQAPLPSRSIHVEFSTSDGSGDRLTGIIEEPLVAASGPLVLLIHGLTGDLDSSYIRRSARFHLKRGRPVLRLNLRGAGSSRLTAKGYYHSGSVSDLQDVLDGLDEAHRKSGVVAVGYSLGGNILLNLLGQLRPGQGLTAAATVSAPIEPYQACRRLMAPRNFVYHRWLLDRMKRDVIERGGLSSLQRQAVENCRSVYEFDDRFVAPRHGFRDANDYYERTAGARQVPSIAVPTLLLHACNDPWIPVDDYFELGPKVSSPVQMLLARSGGHVGFHERGHSETWHDRMIDAFLARTL